MLLTRLSLLAAILLLGAAASLIEPSVLNPRNLANILTQSAVLGVIAVGMTFVIVAGGIDLSVGSIAAFSGVLFATLLSDQYSYFSALSIALAGCGLLGFANGKIVTHLKLSPFVATLGMMGIARGLAFIVSGGEPISGVAHELRAVYQPLIGLITPATLIFLSAALLGHIVLTSTVWGMRLTAVGSNELAAMLSGLKVARYKVMSFVIVALCSGFAGSLLVARLGSGQPLAGALYELDAIAAVVIGGGSLNGGRGDVVGTILGVILIVQLRNIVTVLGMPSHAQPIFIGALLIVAVALDINRTRNRIEK